LLDDSPQNIQRLLGFLARHRDSNGSDSREPLIFDIESEYISQLGVRFHSAADQFHVFLQFLVAENGFQPSSIIESAAST